MYPRTLRILRLVAQNKVRLGCLPVYCLASSSALHRCEASRNGLSYTRFQQAQQCRRLATADQPPGHDLKQKQQQQEQQKATSPALTSTATSRLKEAVIKVIPRKKERPRFDSSHHSLERNFITAVRAMSEFLLKPSDLENLRKTKRRSPFENEPPITVYWRKDVEAKYRGKLAKGNRKS
ncbi:Zinc transporter 9 [Portunus trituberculatus]|uniref:Zinc transporter 9 n=1 Tax=Portunus trituberculatus TaxID=210409 RepID=A0A5B7CFB7_PORTR|nr:Zinc transporter 9 [Portunus trituberculatus]